MVETFLNLGKVLEENKDLASLPFVTKSQQTDLDKKRHYLKKCFLVTLNTFDNFSMEEIDPKEDPLIIITASGNKNNYFYGIGDINMSAKLSEGGQTPFSFRFKKFDNKNGEDSPFVETFRKVIKDPIEAIFQEEIKRDSSDSILIQFIFRDPHNLFTNEDPEEILSWDAFYDEIASVVQKVINTDYIREIHGKYRITTFPKLEISEGKSNVDFESYKEAYCCIIGCYYALQYLQYNLYGFHGMIVPLGNFSYSDLVAYDKVINQLQLPLYDDQKEQESDLLNSSALENNFERTKFDFIFTFNNENTKNTGVLIYIPSLYGSSFLSFLEKWQNAFLKIRKNAAKLGVKSFKPNPVTLICTVMYSTLLISHGKIVFKSILTDEKRVKSEIFYSLFTDNFCYENLFLRKVIKIFEFLLRNNTKASNLSVIEKYKENKLNWVYIHIVLHKKNIMKIESTPAFHIGNQIGMLCNLIAPHINSFEAQYLGQLSRRIENRKKCEEFVSSLIEKIILHKNDILAFANINSQSIFDTTTALSSAFSKLEEKEYIKENVVLGVFSTYFILIKNKS